jgi:hypothetical protein
VENRVEELESILTWLVPDVPDINFLTKKNYQAVLHDVKSAIVKENVSVKHHFANMGEFECAASDTSESDISDHHHDNNGNGSNGNGNLDSHQRDYNPNETQRPNNGYQLQAGPMNSGNAVNYKAGSKSFTDLTSNVMPAATPNPLSLENSFSVNEYNNYAKKSEQLSGLTMHGFDSVPTAMNDLNSTLNTMSFDLGSFDADNNMMTNTNTIPTTSASPIMYPLVAKFDSSKVKQEIIDDFMLNNIPTESKQPFKFITPNVFKSTSTSLTSPSSLLSLTSYTGFEDTGETDDEGLTQALKKYKTVSDDEERKLEMEYRMVFNYETEQQI